MGINGQSKHDVVVHDEHNRRVSLQHLIHLMNAAAMLACTAGAWRVSQRHIIHDRCVHICQAPVGCFFFPIKMEFSR